MTPGIVWLASYPKSGNTWLRVLLANYQSGRDEPVSINDLGGLIASHRHLFDEMVGVEASELSPHEVATYRAAAYRMLAAEAGRQLFVKVHDAYRTPDAESLFPADAHARVIYLIRNPLDIVPSLAHHHGVSIDAAVNWICAGVTLSPHGDDLREQLEQVLLPWSDHVTSWVEAPSLPIMVVRYEDLIADACTVFRTVVRFCELPEDDDRIERAATFSSFDELRRQEQQLGFRERAPRADVFFRQGRSGGWRTVLTPQQVDRIICCHAAIMRRHGYLGTDVTS